jgi:small subunit ribosomal protein S16
MLMIRFQRIGRKNDAAFRIAVLEKTSGPKAGKYVDLVGTYNPKTKATTIQGEKVKDWVKKGAQVSPSVMNLLITNKVMEGKKTQVISKKNLEKNVAKKAAEEAAAREAKEAADAKAKADADAAAQAQSDAEAAVATSEVETPVEESAPEVEATPEEAPTEAASEEVAA